MHADQAVNWLLQARQEDDTSASHGWSYRLALIQIALLQEIRDTLRADLADRQTEPTIKP